MLWDFTSACLKIRVELNLWWLYWSAPLRTGVVCTTSSCWPSQSFSTPRYRWGWPHWQKMWKNSYFLHENMDFPFTQGVFFDFCSYVGNFCRQDFTAKDLAEELQCHDFFNRFFFDGWVMMMCSAYVIWHHWSHKKKTQTKTQIKKKLCLLKKAGILFETEKTEEGNHVPCFFLWLVLPNYAADTASSGRGILD